MKKSLKPLMIKIIEVFEKEDASPRDAFNAMAIIMTNMLDQEAEIKSRKKNGSSRSGRRDNRSH